MNIDGNIIARIRKLLALARDAGATEAEAAVAMRKASDLMMQHNIDAALVDNAPEAVKVIQSNNLTDAMDKYQMMIVQAVACLYDCRTLKYGDRYCFVGRPFNIQACEETLPFVLDQLEAQYKIALKAFKGDRRLTKDERGNFRTTFKEACALKVWRTAREIKAAQKNQIPDHKALVVVNTMEQEVDSFLDGMNLKKGRAVTLRKSGFGTGAGFAAAANIKLQGRVNK